jgi:hypothetical protein
MKFTKSHKKSMRAVANGADVLSPIIARDLRDVQKAHPEFIEITRPMGRYTVKQHHPYFGAILTSAGKAACNA